MNGGYFDHNATTPLDPRAREAMLPWLGERHGNPSSSHGWGRASREAVEAARERVARLLDAAPPEVVFTASGTEANNAVVMSSARRAGFSGRIVTTALEHPSVAAAAEVAAAGGMEVVEVPPEPNGVVDPDRLGREIVAGTRLVCLMLANNELGTVQPVAEVAAICRERGVPILTDAVQAAGKIPVSVAKLGVDYLVVGAHKLYGPLGAAALWIRRGAPLEPLLVGGGQERRRRAGTENVAALAGFGAAAELAAAELPERGRTMAALRDRFEAGLEAVGDTVVHAASSPRLPNTSHVAIRGVSAEALAIRLDMAGWAVSTGSACASGAVEPSRLLAAMAMNRDEALASLRVSLGSTNTPGEVDRFLDLLALEAEELRRLASAPAAP